jgi:hypothetical protein
MVDKRIIGLRLAFQWALESIEMLNNCATSMLTVALALPKQVDRLNFCTDMS